LGFVGGKRGVHFSIDRAVAIERLIGARLFAHFLGDIAHLSFDPRQMPRLVLGDGLQDFHRFGIDAGQGGMGGIAALG